MTEKVRRTGFEISQEFEAKHSTRLERMKPERSEIMAFVYSFIPLFIVFLIACWLAGNPFENTARIDSVFNQNNGLVGTNTWYLIPSVDHHRAHLRVHGRLRRDGLRHRPGPAAHDDGL